MDREVAEFAASYQKFMEAMLHAADTERSELTELGTMVQDFLGLPLTDVDPVVETFPTHQAVDLDAALADLVTELGGRAVGINGPMAHGIEVFAEFLQRSHWNFRPGAVSYVRLPTGPDTDRRVVNCGLSFLTYEDTPLVWLQRGAAKHYGRESYTLELLCPKPEVVDHLLRRVRDAMATNSLLRGQVISLQPNDFDYHAPGEDLTFQARPTVTDDQVILPDGVLNKIVGHVVGIGEHRDVLRAAGQHLKRGVLLYGPPGTGKTHIIRHLITRATGTTVVLLSGRTLGLLGVAARLARATQPAIVVLEDCDLIAEERGGETNAALFETLEALDGLDGDADVTFILTTNRPDLLERALAERPGRVDLAVQIEKPDLEGRRRLLQLYAAGLLSSGQLSTAAIDAAAEQTDGVTASFAKELVRRVVVRAAREGRAPHDDDLIQAVEEMQSDAELFTRVLLGGVYDSDDDPASAPGRSPRAGWQSYGSHLQLGFDDRP